MKSDLTYSSLRHVLYALRAIVCLVILQLLVLGPASAQDLSNAQLIAYKDGLPGSRVNDMVTDSLGFIWIGTNGGLVRYDGTRMKVFHEEKDDPNSLGGSNVHHIMLDGPYLWCSHNKGISKFDMRDETSRTYAFPIKNPYIRKRRTQDATFVMRMRDGSIWAGLRHDGVLKYDAVQDSFIRVRPPMEILRPRYDGSWGPDHIRSAIEDREEDGILWVGTLAGLLRLDTRTEQFSHFFWEQEDKEWETNFNVFRRMVQLPDGRICWGAWHTGTHIVDTEKNIYYRLPNTGDDGGITTSTITRLTIVGDTTLWISTGLGVMGYDLQRERVESLWLNDYARGLEYSFDFIDDENRVYGNVAEGLSVYDPILQQFKGYSFASLDPSRRGMLFDAYYDEVAGKYLLSIRQEGAYEFTPGINKWEKISLPGNLDDRMIANMKPTRDGNGTYYIQVTEEIFVYDLRKGEFTGEKYRVDFPTGTIKDMIEDDNGIIWLSTNRDGIFHLKRHTGEFYRFSTPGVQTVSAGERGVFALDSQGRVWIKKRNSLHVYVPEENRLYDFMSEGFSLPYIQTFAEYDGYMYFVSSSRLMRLPIDNFNTTSPDTIVLNHGFPNVTVSPDGVLWGANKRYLYRYDPKTGESDYFSFNYGSAPSQVFNYSFTNDGRILLGDFEQLIIVDPDELRENTAMAMPYVSKMTVGDRDMYPNLHSQEENKVSLAHDEGFFSIDISSISFVMSDRNKFKYRLVDLQDEWTEVSGAQTINFTSVPSGDYSFELMASNNEGIWNEDPYRLNISVATPWYETTIARVLAVMVLLLLAFLAYQYRIAQIRKEERLRTQYERQLADVEMSALRAQMNPHFIFNCLNSIENFIIKNDTYRASTYLHDFARLIRLILQNSRAQYIPLKDELEALEIYLEMESLRFTNKFEYEIMVEPEVDINTLEVPPMIIQPYVENAIWHGLIPKGEPGRLVVHLSMKDGVLSCSIEDNGIGRKRSAEINSKRKHDKPKSMGMSITSERINIMNNLYNTNTTIEITDKVDTEGKATGTLVELNVPVE